MEHKPIEEHPLKPFLPSNTKVLMLGSFPPPQKRWSMEFYYPNLNNDMWRIIGFLFFENKFHFLNDDKKSFHKEDIIKFLNKKGIAFYDSATRIRRLKDNASDKFLEIVTPTDVKQLLRNIPSCEAIVTTGQKATDILIEHFQIDEPKIGECTEFNFEGKKMHLYRMPSTSRAYPVAVEKKALMYKTMFQNLSLLK